MTLCNILLVFFSTYDLTERAFCALCLHYRREKKHWDCHIAIYIHNTEKNMECLYKRMNELDRIKISSCFQLNHTYICCVVLQEFIKKY